VADGSIPQTDRVAELEFQLAVTRAMLGALEVDKVLYIILSGITHGDGLKFNRAVLFLADDSGRELLAVNAVGPASGAEAQRIWQEIESRGLDLEGLLQAYDQAQRDATAQSLSRMLGGLRVKLRQVPTLLGTEGAIPLETLVAHTAATRRSWLSNTMKVTFVAPHNDKLKVMSHVASVPLVLGDKVLGVIVADNFYTRRHVDAEVMRSLITVSNLAAIAIDKARLHERLRALAEVDGLTGVMNRGHYDARVREELLRAEAVGRPVSLMMVDVDHFKLINDTYGHEHGDHVLKAVAQCLRERVRAEDVVARYGGEEFAVLLTGGQSSEDASQVAEIGRAHV
jgi:GAF domain-containing protein